MSRRSNAHSEKARARQEGAAESQIWLLTLVTGLGLVYLPSTLRHLMRFQTGGGIQVAQPSDFLVGGRGLIRPGGAQLFAAQAPGERPYIQLAAAENAVAIDLTCHPNDEERKVLASLNANGCPTSLDDIDWGQLPRPSELDTSEEFKKYYPIFWKGGFAKLKTPGIGIKIPTPKWIPGFPKLVEDALQKFGGTEGEKAHLRLSLLRLAIRISREWPKENEVRLFDRDQLQKTADCLKQAAPGGCHAVMSEIRFVENGFDCLRPCLQAKKKEQAENKFDHCPIDCAAAGHGGPTPRICNANNGAK